MSGRFKAPALPGKMRDPLSQKVPANPKYKDVRPTVDTGASMTRYLERLHETKSNYKYKKGEIFKRIKVTSLVGLMIKVAEMNEAVAEEQRKKAASSDDGATSDGASGTVVASAYAGPSESVQASRPSSSRSFSIGATSETAAFLPPPAMSTRSARSKRSEPIIAASLPYFPHPSSLWRSADSANISSPSSSLSRPATSYSRSNSSLKGLIGGFGERTTSLESVEDKENSATPSSLEPPYLLLDIREEDAFNSGHLRTAINFPSSRLSRAMNFETKELRSFRNGDGKIVVVYDEDETMAPRAAAILVQRGYDNVYLLSGGINVAEKFFPGGLLMKLEGSSVIGATSPLVLGATSPLVLSSEENARLQSQLEGAKKASSPSHRPTVNTSFDRRRTQMMGGQFKAKKAVPKPIW